MEKYNFSKPDDQADFQKLPSEQKEQIVEDGREEAIAQDIKRKEFAESLKLEKSVEELKEGWADFYKNIFGIESDFSNINIPETQEDFKRLIIMEKGVTAKQLFEKCEELFPTERDGAENLIEGVKSVRNAIEEGYAIWVRESNEADEILKNNSVKDIEIMGITTETLEERLLDEIRYFIQTGGSHLDLRHPGAITLCTGSRIESEGKPWDGKTPFAYWNHGEFTLGLSDSELKNNRLRARQVIV